MSGVTEIGMSGERIFRRSRPAHMLCLSNRSRERGGGAAAVYCIGLLQPVVGQRARRRKHWRTTETF